jgi:UDPglucose--hexose-1-phosphate uridylyltransferase
MELRKDPITRSWVVVGHRESVALPSGECPLCPSAAAPAPLLQIPAQGDWRVCVRPHPDALYHIEGDAGQEAEGIYDKMKSVGAHELIAETPAHEGTLAYLPDDQIEAVLEAYRQRIQDLKRDKRFKYITVFRNRGLPAGEEFTHPHSEITATAFVPRRIIYELRAARAWYQEKERCVFCDIVRQDERRGHRLVDTQGDYVALCPYASRVPFEVWLMSRRHNHLFEQPSPKANRHDLAMLLGRTLRRIGRVTGNYHMVLHTAPNTADKRGDIKEYWKTLADDYHWHIEILPILEKVKKSYSIKEVYFNSLLPEEAAERLRQIDPAP